MRIAQKEMEGAAVAMAPSILRLGRLLLTRSAHAARPASRFAHPCGPKADYLLQRFLATFFLVAFFFVALFFFLAMYITSLLFGEW